MSDPRPAFLCVTVKAGLEKRRYLLFASVSAAKSLVSATFFTERERPAGTVMHEKAHCPQWGLNSSVIFAIINKHIVNFKQMKHNRENWSQYRPLEIGGVFRGFKHNRENWSQYRPLEIGGVFRGFLRKSRKNRQGGNTSTCWKLLNQ